MKYTLELSGVGRECSLHKVSDNEWNALWALYKQHDHSFDDLDNADVLEKTGLGSNAQDIQGEALKTLCGPFASPGEFQLVVRDETGAVLFHSDDVDADTLQEVLDSGCSSDSTPCLTASWTGTGHDEELWICVADMIKGGFWTAEIESEVHVPFFYFLFPNMDFGNREIEGGLYLGIPNSPFGQM